MIRSLFYFVLAAAAPLMAQQQQPPRGNPYDLIGKIFQPLAGVLLAETQGANRAATLDIEISEISGRLPAVVKGAKLQAAVQFPDKMKLVAPIMGEQFTVCRNGSEVWATPGKKVEFLVSKFNVKAKENLKLSTPILVPVTAKQAIFLPALFSVRNPDVAEIESLNGEDCRVLSAGLMPELAKVTKAEDFLGRVWVAPDFTPRRFEITRRDFTATADVHNLAYVPSLPASTWQAPAGDDIYRTTPEMLEAILYVVMNSLQAREGDTPWLNAR